jgi:nucleoredoxin
MAFEKLFGATLVNNSGAEVKTSELSCKKGSVIGLYFSAHWCPPCRVFTPKLATVYNEIKKAGHDFEVVFISSDRSEKDFKSYHGEMPWLAIPHDNEEEKDACSEKYSITGLPTFVLVDGETGETITTDGRDVVGEFGAAGFPFTDARLEECKKEKEAKKSKALAEMRPLSFIGPLTKVSDIEIEMSAQDVWSSSETVALAFMAGSNDRGTSVVLPKLLDCQSTLGKDKLSVVLIPLVEMKSFGEDLKKKLGDTAMVKPGEKADEIVKKFEVVSSDIEAPCVIVLSRNADNSFKLLADDASRDIYFKGAAGFPWSVEALSVLKEKEEAAKKALKAQQKDLEFLSTGETSHVIDKKGDTVALSTLQSKDVVGLYFSAHWCGPCRSFTPQLAKLYNECKEKNKSFEIVFISSDRSEKDFQEYFKEMPWCALDFKERDLKSKLSDVFDVQGIPTLVLLTGKGEMITEQGRDAVGAGVDSFPWKKTE